MAPFGEIYIPSQEKIGNHGLLFFCVSTKD